MIERTDDAPSLLADRYLLGRELGRGGMAVVHQAWDCVLDRDVAVKMVRDVVMDPTVRDRFEIEVRTLAGLSHPGLIMLLDAGTQDDHPYLVMELVEGETLAEVGRRRLLEPREVAAIGVALAEALSYVHDCGIVHRDVKPGNILIGHDQRVRLADFGIARILDSPVRHTATGLVIGTAAYLSPEQVRSESVTGASDVYSLGLVLIEILTGRPVFPGPPHLAALARLVDAPAIDVALPPALRDVLAAMTSDLPAKRPTAAEVVVLLQQVIAESDSGEIAFIGSPGPRPSVVDDDEPETVSTQEVAATADAPTATSRSFHRLGGRILGVAAAITALAFALVLSSPLGASRESPRTSSTATNGAATPRPSEATSSTEAPDGSALPSASAGAARPVSAVSNVSTPANPHAAAKSKVEDKSKDKKKHQAKSEAKKGNAGKGNAGKGKADKGK